MGVGSSHEEVIPPKNTTPQLEEAEEALNQIAPPGNDILQKYEYSHIAPNLYYIDINTSAEWPYFGRLLARHLRNLDQTMLVIHRCKFSWLLGYTEKYTRSLALDTATFVSHGNTYTMTKMEVYDLETLLPRVLDTADWWFGGVFLCPIKEDAPLPDGDSQLIQEMHRVIGFQAMSPLDLSIEMLTAPCDGYECFWFNPEFEMNEEEEEEDEDEGKYLNESLDSSLAFSNGEKRINSAAMLEEANGNSEHNNGGAMNEEAIGARKAIPVYGEEVIGFEEESLFPDPNPLYKAGNGDDLCFTVCAALCCGCFILPIAIVSFAMLFPVACVVTLMACSGCALICDKCCK